MTTREQQIAELQRIARTTAEKARIAGLQRIARETKRAVEALTRHDPRSVHHKTATPAHIHRRAGTMRNKLFRLATSTIVAGVMASIVLNAMPQAAMAAAPPAPYFNGFENSDDT